MALFCEFCEEQLGLGNRPDPNCELCPAEKAEERKISLADTDKNMRPRRPKHEHDATPTF